MRYLLYLIAVVSSVIVFAGSSPAEERSGSQALAGLKEVRVYYDLNVGDPEKLLMRLKFIEITNEQLSAAGRMPRVVVGVRGKASNFFTQGDGFVLDSDLPVKKEIAAKVAQFQGKGYHLEQCRLAAGIQEIPVKDFLPQLELVDNGYVSMISYQEQGYAFVPMD